jgi:hypothetical protein
LTPNFSGFIWGQPETVSIDEDDPDEERGLVMGVLDLAEIIPRTEGA